MAYALNMTTPKSNKMWHACQMLSGITIQNCSLALSDIILIMILAHIYVGKIDLEKNRYVAGNTKDLFETLFWI